MALKSNPAAFALALVALSGLPGCASTIADRIVRAPNHGKLREAMDDPPAADLALFGVDQAFRVEVGPPPASLSVWLREPRDAQGKTATVPRGTVILLHGFRKAKRSLLRLAAPLVAGGFRAVLVDLRGHGASTGDWMTHGVIESRDLAQVIDALEAQGMAAGPVGVFGISYGAAAAIQLAAREPRVAAVVAVASYTSLREIVPRYVRLFVPVYGWFASDAAIQEAISAAGVRGGFDPTLASPLHAIRKTHAPVLLIHGSCDLLIPPGHSEALKAAAGNRARLVLIGGIGHNAIFRDPTGEVARESVEWFAASRAPMALKSNPAPP